MRINERTAMRHRTKPAEPPRHRLHCIGAALVAAQRPGVVVAPANSGASQREQRAVDLWSRRARAPVGPRQRHNQRSQLGLCFIFFPLVGLGVWLAALVWVASPAGQPLRGQQRPSTTFKRRVWIWWPWWFNI